jgi:hypothetical protein
MTNTFTSALSLAVYLSVFFLNLTDKGVTNTGAGQNHEIGSEAKEELRKLYSTFYHPASSFSISGLIRMFESEGVDSAANTTSFQYDRDGNSLYHQQGFQEVIYINGTLLQVDTMGKAVLVSQPDSIMLRKLTAPGGVLERMVNDTLTSFTSATVSQEGGEKVLTFFKENPPGIKSTSIYYNPSTYRITKTVVVGWKDPMATVASGSATWEINISYTYSAPAGSGAIQSKWNNVVQLVNGTVQLKPAYEHYQLHMLM